MGSLGSEVAIRPKSAIQAIVSYEDSYVQPLILSAIESLFPGILDVTTKEQSSLAEFGDEKVLQITAYESIDFEYAASHEKT